MKPRRSSRSWMVGVGLLLLVVASAAACGGDASPKADTSTTTPIASSPTQAATAEATATDSPDQKVMDAYLTYWQRYSDAVLNLNAQAVADMASPEELARVQDEVETLRQQGVAMRVVVEHHPVVLDSSATSAVIYDEMTNNSFHVDPETKNPPQASGDGQTLKDTFFLEKVDGQWKVMRSVRQD